MRLIDRIAQASTPYLVQNQLDGSITCLTGPSTFAEEIKACPTRYVFTDELTRLCTALAYSKGARVLSCADLLRVPTERMWVEWCDSPWCMELLRYGFRPAAGGWEVGGRRGAYIVAAPNGRRGLVRTFWTNGEREADLLASSMEAYFDLDTPDGAEPACPDLTEGCKIVVADCQMGDADILRRCFRFRFERTWAQYYSAAQLSDTVRDAVTRHALGTIAIAMPVLLAFFLLMITRPGLPRRPVPMERLNQSRIRSGKPRLLDHIEVSAPLTPECRLAADQPFDAQRRSPRLHHVRGHLVRRGSEIHWRVPHLRGNARLGAIKTRTVTWTVNA